MMKDKIHYSIIIFWLIFWIYLYNNPIHLLWQPLLLLGIPVYLFLSLLFKLTKKKLNETSTKVLIGFSILVILLHALVDHNTFRSKTVAKILVDRLDAGQWRYLVLRENGKFEDYAEDWLHIQLFGIDFRESFGLGSYDKYEDNTISIYYRRFISELYYKPLNDETVNAAIRDVFISNVNDTTKNDLVKSESSDTISFISYQLDGKFKTKELQHAWVTLFPNLGSRNGKWKYNLDGKSYEFPEKMILHDVYGINQFFMDFDMTTGFVHRYTQNFHDNYLSDNGFVLSLTRSSKNLNQARICYKQKRDLTSEDKLGQNIGFCRQWKLSEIDMAGEKVNMKRKNTGQYFIQIRPNSDNGFGEIPIWSNQPLTDGYADVKVLKSFDNFNGGTAVIIWKTVEGEIYFEDIHGSISYIISELKRIAKKYKVDPTLGIYDAAGMAQKLQSKTDFTLDVSQTDKWCGPYNYVGAGYAFNLKQ